MLDEELVELTQTRTQVPAQAPAHAEIDLDTVAVSEVDEDGFFDRSGNDLSVPDPDENAG